jgi:hypothetical protein
VIHRDNLYFCDASRRSRRGALAGWGVRLAMAGWVLGGWNASCSGADVPDPAVAVTDSMMQQYREVRASLPENASAGDQESAADKTPLGAAAYRYISRIVERLKKQAELDNPPLPAADDTATPALLNMFLQPQMYQQLARQLPGQADALNQQAAIVAEARRRAGLDAAANSPSPAAQPATSKPTSLTASIALLSPQDTTELYVSDLDAANEQVIRPWLSKLGIYSELDPSAQRAIEALQTGDTAAKQEALSQLKASKAYSAVPVILKSLDDPAVSTQAVEVLGSFGPAASDAAPAIVSQAMRLVTEPDSTPTDSPYFDRASTIALQKIGAASIPPLYGALASDSAPQRIWAANKLTAMFQDATARLAKPNQGDRIVLGNEIKALDIGAAKLIPLLADPVPGVRNAGVSAVVASSLPADQVLEPLLKLFKDSVPAPRFSAIRAVGSLGPPASGAAANLAALVSDNTPFVAPLAASSLSQLGAAGLQPLIDQYPRLKRPRLKIAVLQALVDLRRSVIGAALAQEDLIDTSTQDRDDNVRLAGLKLALARFDPHFHFPVRRVWDTSVAAWAGDLAVGVGNSSPAPASTEASPADTDLPKTDQALIRALQSTTNPDRLLVAQNMGSLSESALSQATPLIKSFLRSKDLADEVVGMNAVKSLGPRGKPFVMDFLAVLDSDRFEVAMVGLKTLGDMGPIAADAVTPLNQRLNDPQAKNQSLNIMIPNVIAKIEGAQ